MYLLVRAPGDIVRAIEISAAPSMLAGAACLAILAQRGAVKWIRPTLTDLGSTLRGGWHLFLSTAAISLYSTTNVVLLGFVAGDAAVGYFSGAEKLTRAATGLMSPVSQSFYPRISRLMVESPARAFELIRRLLRIQGLLGALISLLLAGAAPLLVRLLYGPAFSATVEAVRLLSPLPLLITLSNVLGVQTMLPLRMQRTVSTILILTGGVNVVMLYVLARLFSTAGACVSVVVAEGMVAALMAIALWSRGTPIFPQWLTGSAR
jgi:PST family polysaccharide transporter